MFLFKGDDDEDGEAFDLSKMEREGEDDMAGVKVHEIKFDEYGIMDDGVDDSTADKLKEAGVSIGGASTQCKIVKQIYDCTSQIN